MHNTAPTIQTARVRHVCTWCGQLILAGTEYHRWVTFDDSAFTSKMHPECVPACDADSRDWGGEYHPYDNERPQPVVEAT